MVHVRRKNNADPSKRRLAGICGRPNLQNLSQPVRRFGEQEVNVLIDCQQCAMRDTSACDDCLVTCLLGESPVDLSASQTEAFRNLADEGLVPKLRLVPAERRVS